MEMEYQVIFIYELDLIGFPPHLITNLLTF